MYRFLILLAAAFLGCLQPAQEQKQSSNPSVPVELLFEFDGCKVYRFSDNGRSHYYIDCRGSTMATQSCGKSCTYSEQNQTRVRQ